MAFHNVPPNGFPDLPDMEDLEAVVKDVTGLKTSVAGLTEDVGDLDSNKASKADIATEFSDLTNYNAGDLVYYEGDLFEFQVDHTAGSWETSEVIQKDLSDIVNTLKSGLTYKQGDSITFNAWRLRTIGRTSSGRTKVNVEIQLDRPITHFTSVTFGDATAVGAVYTSDGVKECTITYDTANFNNNYLDLSLNITPNSAWSETTDVVIMFESRSAITLNF